MLRRTKKKEIVMRLDRLFHLSYHGQKIWDKRATISSI